MEWTRSFDEDLRDKLRDLWRRSCIRPSRRPRPSTPPRLILRAKAKAQAAEPQARDVAEEIEIIGAVAAVLEIIGGLFVAVMTLPATLPFCAALLHLYVKVEEKLENILVVFLIFLRILVFPLPTETVVAAIFVVLAYLFYCEWPFLPTVANYYYSGALSEFYLNHIRDFPVSWDLDSFLGSFSGYLRNSITLGTSSWRWRQMKPFLDDTLQQLTKLLNFSLFVLTSVISAVWFVMLGEPLIRSHKADVGGWVWLGTAGLRRSFFSVMTSGFVHPQKLLVLLEKYFIGSKGSLTSSIQQPCVHVLA